MPNQRRQARIDWLLAHPEMWQGWVADSEGGDTRKRKREIVEAMRRDGVISETTYWVDVQLTNLIKDARRQKREEKANASQLPQRRHRPH